MDLAHVNVRLRGHRVTQLADAVAALEEAVTNGTIRNADFVRAKEAINRAADESFESLNAAISNWDYRTLVMGAWNVPAALAEATRAGIGPRIELLTALMPLHALLQSTKPLIVKRQQKSEASAKPAGHMTCQVCARSIGATAGPIAHHGYRRPGNFTQTRSCAGAGAVPYEAGRDRLGSLIADLREQELRELQSLADVEAERAPVTLSIPDRSKPIGAYGRPKREIVLTREDATEMLASIDDGGIPITSFDDAKARCIAARRSTIGHLRYNIAPLQQRYDGWTITHRWDVAREGWTPVKGMDARS